MRFIKGLYFTNWFFIALLIVALAFIMAFAIPAVFIIAQGTLVLIIAVIFLESFILFSPKKPISLHRKVNQPISLGDKNPVKITVKNEYQVPIRVQILDNPPVQLQLRDLAFNFFLGSSKTKAITYSIKPTERGEYIFDDVFVFASTFLHFVQRKIIIKDNIKVSAYPSIIQMKKMELKVFTKTADIGIKKIRRLGHNNEFEQIKNYVQGDDFRTVNWKATGRRNELMVNQYQDERSQNIYSIIDKSRSMRMPFDNLSLLDYAINSSLAFSNIAIKKGDKIGLHTFSDKLGSFLKADRSTGQLRRIMELLYSQKTHFLEADFNLLYQNIHHKIKGRSLIMLYTNIETEYALKRVLPHLKRINKKHLLVVIFFENTEINGVINNVPKHVGDIYLRTFAEKYKMDKKKNRLRIKKKWHSNNLNCTKKPIC